MKFLKWRMGCLMLPVLIFVMMFFMLNARDNSSGGSEGGGEFTGAYTEDLPIFDELKGDGQFTDEIVQLAVGVGVKYRLLPSVVLSQWAYESAWGASSASQSDNNFFGITWFLGCPYPQGSARGIGGSEGGYYMKFPDMKASFAYYGFMLATQTNFNLSVGNRSPSEVLLILGRGGYAEAGITESSSYYKSCMSIIESYELEKYDSFAIERWGTGNNTGGGGGTGIGNISVLDTVLNQTVNNGECYGLTAFYVDKMGGPQLMGSGKMNAWQIGEDYPWSSFGWEVIFNPKFSDLQEGDVINWYPNQPISPGNYGHTGIISSVGKDGAFSTYEQNAEQGRICAKYNRSLSSGAIASIVRKVK